MKNVRKLVDINLGFNVKEENTEVKIGLTNLFYDMITDFGCKDEVLEKLESVAKELDDMLVFINNSKKENK